MPWVKQHPYIQKRTKQLNMKSISSCNMGSIRFSVCFSVELWNLELNCYIYIYILLRAHTPPDVWNSEMVWLNPFSGTSSYQVNTCPSLWP